MSIWSAVPTSDLCSSRFRTSQVCFRPRPRATSTVHGTQLVFLASYLSSDPKERRNNEGPHDGQQPSPGPSWQKCTSCKNEALLHISVMFAYSTRPGDVCERSPVNGRTRNDMIGDSYPREKKNMGYLSDARSLHSLTSPPPSVFQTDFSPVLRSSIAISTCSSPRKR